MRWYHVLVAGMTVLLVLTVCAAFYVAADRESGGGVTAAGCSRTVQAAPEQPAPEPESRSIAPAGEGGCLDDACCEPGLEPCHHCGGSGETPCGICGGDGMAEVDCPTCGGSGYVSGETPDDVPWVHPIRLPCPDCGASGRVPGPCAACGGLGWVPCANCGGSGCEPCEGGG